MKVRDVIKELEELNPEAKLFVVADGKRYEHFFMNHYFNEKNFKKVEDKVAISACTPEYFRKAQEMIAKCNNFNVERIISPYLKIWIEKNT